MVGGGQAPARSPLPSVRSVLPLSRGRHSERSQKAIPRVQAVARPRGGQSVTSGDLLPVTRESAPDGAVLARKVLEALGGEPARRSWAVAEPPAVHVRPQDDADHGARDRLVPLPRARVSGHRAPAARLVSLAALLVAAGAEATAVETELRRWLDGGAGQGLGNPPVAQGSSCPRSAGDRAVSALPQQEGLAPAGRDWGSPLTAGRSGCHRRPRRGGMRCDDGERGDI